MSERPMLHCYCCGAVYEQGRFSCCRPPNGMRSEIWLALACPMPDQGGCGKCVQHCQCPSKAQRLGNGPLAELARAVLASVALEKTSSPSVSPRQKAS